MRNLAVVVFLAATACAAPADSPLPFDIGGSFELTDQFGQARTQADPGGHAQLLFFGYANCQNICSAALPDMADVVDIMAEEGITVTPVMVTVAPDQDSVATMGAPLAEIHPAFIGLTGNTEALAAAYAAFSVEVKPLFQDPEYGWIYSHGSFLHLLDGAGNVLTLVPPVLGVEETARILRTYLSAENT